MIRYGGLVFPDRWGAGACDFTDDQPARAVRYVPKRREVEKKQAEAVTAEPRNQRRHDEEAS